MSIKKEALVVGFGAVGVVYSFILKHAGKANVTCVARGNYDATQEHGIHIKSRKYGDIHGWKPDRLFRTVSDAADRKYSHVIVATKALPDVTPTSSLLAPLLTQDPLPAFVLIQNGLSAEKDLYETIKKMGKEPNIISTALWIATALQEGNVVVQNVDERLHIGTYRPGYQLDIKDTVEEIAVLEGFVDLLKPCGSVVHIEPEVQSVKFRKNFWNATLSTCSALTRHPPQVFFRNPEIESHLSPQLYAIMQEILAIGRAIGFDERALPSDIVTTTLSTAENLYKDPTNNHRLSMLVDIELGRPMEVDVIVGELVRNAKKYHVDVPRLELIYSLLQVLQHQVVVGDLPYVNPNHPVVSSV